MKQPLLIHLPDDVRKNIKNVKYKPGLCEYHVPYTACELIPLPGAPIVRQQFRHVGFYMQLLEINAAEDITIRFSVLYPATFLTFMLRGTINFFDEHGNQISQALGGTFYLSYNGIVTYEARLKKGPNQLLIVTLSENELLPAKADFPKFDELIQHLAEHHKEPVILPYCHIGQTIWNYLDKILHYTAINAIERGAGILVLLTKCLTFYHGLLENHQYLPAYDQLIDAKRIENFLLKYYTTEKGNNLSSIATALNLSIRRIREVAAVVFKKTVHQYVHELRMQRAAHLLKNTGNSVKTIGLNVGFDNNAYFCRAFKKRFDVTPVNYRNRYISGSDF